MSVLLNMDGIVICYTSCTTLIITLLYSLFNLNNFINKVNNKASTFLKNRFINQEVNCPCLITFNNVLFKTRAETQVHNWKRAVNAQVKTKPQTKTRYSFFLHLSFHLHSPADRSYYDFRFPLYQKYISYNKDINNVDTVKRAARVSTTS